MKKSIDSNKKKNSRSNSVTKKTKNSSQNKNSQSLYRQTYKEIELIGKGTSGSATLVRHILERKYYISKKIRLSHLSQSDRDNAYQELRLLKELKHPNIVEFKEGFQDQDNMIIIMEYCEDGDLQYHIKRKQDTLDSFSEQTILNWFLQILMALDYIHSKKVLHRDIKASNIFVSQCGSVKIGDFGIAKQLDNTIDKAQTLVGTPYYLSPEVCENKPYTYQSDIWALGCLLYELCTLNHPFSSGNLMTLVMKIINDKVEDIPKKFSLQLNILTKLMLEKNCELRPSSKDVLCTEIMQDVMKKFISSKGNISEQLPIKKLNIHKKKDNIYIQAIKQNQGQILPKLEQSQKRKSQNDKISDMEQKIQNKMNKIQSEVKETKKDIKHESDKKKNNQNQKEEKIIKKGNTIEDKEKYYEKLMQQQQSSVKNSYKELKTEQKQKISEIQKQKGYQMKMSKSNDQNQNNIEDQIGNQKINGDELAKINQQIVQQSQIQQQQSQIQEESRLSSQNLQKLSQNQSQKTEEQIKLEEKQEQDTRHLQMSQQTVVSVQVSERKNSLQSMNLDQTFQSMNMSVSNNIHGSEQSLFQKAQQLKEKEQNLDNISEQTDEQSQQNTCNSSEINKNGSINQSMSDQIKNNSNDKNQNTTQIENQPLPLSVDKINFMNLSLKNPSFYQKNNSFLQDSQLKDDDFNMSLSNNSAFNWQENISKKIEELKKNGSIIKEESENQTNIENNSFLKDSNVSLSMTASRPLDLTGAMTSFNVSKQVNSIHGFNQKNDSNIHQALSNSSKELFQQEFLKNDNDNGDNQKDVNLTSIRTDVSNAQDAMTVTVQFGKINEINSMEQKYDIQQSQQYHKKSDGEQEEYEQLDLLEVREDIDADSSDSREEDTQTDTLEQTEDTEIEEYSKDEKSIKKDLYNERITKNKHLDELDDVLNLYKSQLQQSLIVTETYANKLLKMSEIKETSAEYLSSQSGISNMTK